MGRSRFEVVFTACPSAIKDATLTQHGSGRGHRTLSPASLGGGNPVAPFKTVPAGRLTYQARFGVTFCDTGPSYPEASYPARAFVTIDIPDHAISLLERGPVQTELYRLAGPSLASNSFAVRIATGTKTSVRVDAVGLTERPDVDHHVTPRLLRVTKLGACDATAFS